jgi:hypothetical protein
MVLPLEVLVVVVEQASRDRTDPLAPTAVQATPRAVTTIPVVRVIHPARRHPAHKPKKQDPRMQARTPTRPRPHRVTATTTLLRIPHTAARFRCLDLPVETLPVPAHLLPLQQERAIMETQLLLARRTTAGTPIALRLMPLPRNPLGPEWDRPTSPPTRRSLEEVLHVGPDFRRWTVKENARGRSRKGVIVSGGVC